MEKKHYLVTGGTGFIGSALVRRLVHEGHRVRVLDDNSRGRTARLADIDGRYEFIQGDIRNSADVMRATAGVDSVCHLAFVNGTEFFYSKPELVLDVGVRGMLNVLDACIAHQIPELVLASSSEVYQTPPSVPTDESVPLSVPDPLNPRYSYGGGKIISELMAINYGRKFFKRVLIFRPHNVYGANMGWEHVIPQFLVRLGRSQAENGGTIDFPIQGTGQETRSFVYIDDFTDGVMKMLERGKHLNIYHIGTLEELAISEVATQVAESVGRKIRIIPGELQKGGTPRRCPDIKKISELGYAPRFTLRSAMPGVAKWYLEHLSEAP